MIGSSLLHGWTSLLGSLATIAIVLTALACMLGIVKTSNAPQRLAAILGITILLIMLPSIVVSAWSGMSLWQKIGLVAIGILILQWNRPPRRSKRSKLD